MNMTKEEFAAFRNEIETALAPLAAKYETPCERDTSWRGRCPDYAEYATDYTEE